MSALMVSITSGMSGYFAVLHDEVEPIYTGFDRCATYDDALREAVCISIAEGVQLSPDALKRATELVLTAKILRMAA